MPATTEALQNAAQFGPSIWFAVFIILTIVVCAAAYIKYVGTPARLAAEENNKNLTKVVAQLATVVERTDLQTAATHETVVDSHAVLHAIVTAKVSELDAIAKVAKKAGVDVQKELSEATGVMRFIREAKLADAPN